MTHSSGKQGDPKRLTRRRLLATSAGALVAGCADVPLLADAQKPRPKGGIGGTGIVGTLAGFGSLIVNGLSIETDGSTDVSSALGELTVGDLALGDSLTIEATATPGGLVARRARLVHPVIGRIDRIDLKGGRLTVAGVPVRVVPGASVGAVNAGLRAAVSGLWDGEAVVATRIEPVFTPNDVLAGAVRRSGGVYSVGGRRATFEDDPPPVGAFVTAYGEAGGGVFAVLRYEVGRFTGAAGPLKRLSIEGYLEPIERAPFQEVSGLGHSFDAAASLAPFAERRTLFVGAYEDAFKVEYGVDLPEAAAPRRALIARLAAGEAGERRPAR